MKWYWIVIIILVAGYFLLSSSQKEEFAESAKGLFEDKFSSFFKDDRVWMGKPVFDCKSDEDCLSIEDCFNCSCSVDVGECFQIS